MNNLPVAFTDKLRRLLRNEFSSFEEAMQDFAPVSVRINPSKKITDFNDCSQVPWAANAYYLPVRKSFTLDPLFHAGCYYVQEASSMFLERVIKQVTADNEPVKVLDLCAAPGGKSTQLLSILPEGSLLVSNEVVSSRNIVLQQNITRWGFSNVVITQNDPSDFTRLANFFDIILVDAPCSGEGLFRKQPEAISEWSEAAVVHCAIRQKDLLNAVMPSLKPNGKLIYSTCTYEPAENEEQCYWLEESHSMKRVKIANISEGVLETEFGLRFYPHRVKGEGFFISLLRKEYENSGIVTGKKTSVKKETFDASALLNDPGKFYFYKKENEIYAFPRTLWEDIHVVMKQLYTRKAGIHLGSIKGKDFIPSHELVLSNDLFQEVSKTELDLTESLRYLKCENITPGKIPDGWSVACYRGFPLGWMKGIGRRVNNYYPRSQRVLKSIE